jgi:SAM-dependent methyltransferase
MSSDHSLDYERLTRAAYQTEARATAYKRRQTRQWSWARFATWREQAVIAGLIRELRLGPGSVVLDAPCGTGILAGLLNRAGCDVLAADISIEMMSLARREYQPNTFRGFFQADLIRLPLAPGSVDAVFALGFLHRVPMTIRRQALAELAAASTGPLIATCSLDTVFQWLKVRVLNIVARDYAPAPNPARRADIIADCAAAGLTLAKLRRPVPFLSANAVMVVHHHRDHHS